MLRKVLIGISCLLLFLVLIVIKMNEYKANYLFQNAMIARLGNIEEGQKKILSALGNKPAGPGFRRTPTEDENKVYEIDLTGAILKGDPQGKVTIVEFSDVQCPFSQRFHPIFEEAIKGYPSGVKYVFKNYPLPYHANAKPAIKAAFAAKEQGKYWEMLDLVFQNAKDLSPEKFKELAGQLGLDVNKFSKDLTEKDAEYEALIQKDLDLASSLDVEGTPTFFLNGKKTSARALEEIKKEIDQALAK